MSLIKIMKKKKLCKIKIIKKFQIKKPILKKMQKNLFINIWLKES